MPLAPVDDKGTQLYFEDSGAPSSTAIYATLIIIHGTFWNGGILRPMLQFAEANSLRIVLLNQRDFSGSTPYSQEELNALSSGHSDIQAAFAKERVTEIASFLTWFVTNENIPPLQQTREVKQGGLSLITWSSGNSWMVSLIALANSFPSSNLELLGRYLRSFVIYDAPYYYLGYPVPSADDVYSPLSDPLLTPEQVGAPTGFPLWNSSYYTHSSDTMNSFLSSTLDDLPSREDFIKGLAHGKHPDPSPVGTAFRIPVETLQLVSNGDTLLRSQLHVLAINRDVFRGFSEKAFFDQEIAQKIWPNAKIEVLVCEKTMNYCVHAAWELKR